MEDPYFLSRFVDAQDPVLETVLEELRSGRKRSHWMWFVFPQLKGLGRSWMADKYGISSFAEAEAYIAHPVLGSRLRECTRLVNSVEGRSIKEILGNPDYFKFRSSMTLFERATLDNREFADALGKYFGGRPDQATLDRLERSNRAD